MAYTEGTAYADNTLNGLIRMNDQNLADFEYSELVQPTQFMDALPWFPASNGTQHKWTVETAAPDAVFRALNVGVANGAGSEKTISMDLKILDASFFRDVMVARGATKGVGAYLNREAMKSLNKALTVGESQLINGTDALADGFDGLKDLATLYAADGLAIDEGGSGGTRVYMMITGEDDVCGILGNDGQFVYADEPTIQRILTNVSTGAGYNAYNVPISGYAGLQIGGKYSIATAYNIDGTTGKVVDDALLAELYSKFPSDRKNSVNLILMSSTGLFQLQQSRTATNPTGAPAPFPTSWDAAGRPIRIVISDAVDDAESSVVTTTTTTTT